MISFTKAIRCSTYRSVARTIVSVAFVVPALAGTAFADVAPTTAVPADAVDVSVANHPHGSPVNVAGEVAHYVVGPLGHVRGFLLKDGTAVMLRGAEGDSMAKQVPVGQSVRVEGRSMRGAGGAGSNAAIMHAAVYGQHGQVVAPVPRGERQRDPAERQERWGAMRAEVAKLPAASANGTVQAVVAGRRGKPVALVLTDGTNVFLRPSLAKAVMTRGVRAGDRIESSGKGATYPLGASVVVDSITFADGAHFSSERPR